MDKKYLIVMESFERFQDFQRKKLWQMEEVDLMGRECGALEMTGRAKTAVLNIFFCMQKVDEKNQRKENK
jgi:hypothetical protein